MRSVDLGGEREVTAPGSVSARVRRLAAQTHAVVIEIGGGGVVGRHPAVVAQLFVVVRGSGWVSGADGRARGDRSWARQCSGSKGRSTSRARTTA